VPELVTDATARPMPALDAEHMVPASLDVAGSERRANKVFWLYIALAVLMGVWGIAQAAFGWGPFWVQYRAL
jgi:hypothetical protein